MHGAGLRFGGGRTGSRAVCSYLCQNLRDGGTSGCVRCGGGRMRDWGRAGEERKWGEEGSRSYLYNLFCRLNNRTSFLPLLVMAPNPDEFLPTPQHEPHPNVFLVAAATGPQGLSLSPHPCPHPVPHPLPWPSVSVLSPLGSSVSHDGSFAGYPKL